MSRYACSTCRDIGWIEEPVDSGAFEPILRTTRCPLCNAHAAVFKRSEVALLVLAFLGLLAFVAWGGR